MHYATEKNIQDQKLDLYSQCVYKVSEFQGHAYWDIVKILYYTTELLQMHVVQLLL